MIAAPFFDVRRISERLAENLPPGERYPVLTGPLTQARWHLIRRKHRSHPIGIRAVLDLCT